MDIQSPGSVIASGAEGPAPTERKLREATQQFEALFMDMLLKELEKSTSDGTLFGNMPGGDIYRSMVRGALSERLADPGSLGIADALYRQLAPAAGLDPGTGSPGRAIRAYGALQMPGPEPDTVGDRKDW